MADRTPRTFNHFTVVTFTPSYWALPAAERESIRRAWLDELAAASASIHLYQTFAASSAGDLLVWCAAREQDPTAPQRFFEACARATAPARPYVTVNRTLWGFTRPSPYTKVRSALEMDPFENDRLPYLIIYPFVKTPAWYLEERSKRQAMMAEHMKIGKQFADVRQLLLYSFGLQDQEFVVVYETHDLTRFLDLVEQLRGTEARRYTQRDTPLHLGVHQVNADALARWL